MVVNVKKRGGSGEVAVKNDGVLLASGINCINIDGGAEVEAVITAAGEVTIFHPAPVFKPYWPLGVTDPVERTTARISTPEGGEGIPFKTSGWADTNQDAGRTASFTLASPGNRTGFGGDSTFVIKVFDADGVSLLDSYTTPFLTGNGTHVSPSGRITVTIASYGTDATKFQALPSVTIDILDIFTDNGLDGGRYHVTADHITDSITDTGTSHVFTQSDIFLDTNATTPIISTVSGSVGIVETAGNINTKHLTGLEYYIIGSQFTVTVSGIDQFNRNTAIISSNLRLRGSEFGLSELNHSPFGTGAASFTGYTNDHTRDGVGYSTDDWTITAASYRYIGPTANVDGRPQDTWAVGATVPSLDNKVLIDTFLVTSTPIFDGFDDEDRREFVDGIGGAASSKSFGGVGSFDSFQSASISGTTQAVVFNSRILVPDQTTFIRGDGSNNGNTDWTDFKPDLNGPNPDYTGLGITASGVYYARRFTKTAGINIPSFSMVFSGSFAGGSALADLISGAMEIYVYRIAVPGATPGKFGAPPSNTTPLRVHVPFNFALYDDGTTIAGSGIREGSSSGNTINCTFGTGTPADTGFYCHIVLLNDNIEINSISVTFF